MVLRLVVLCMLVRVFGAAFELVSLQYVRKIVSGIEIGYFDEILGKFEKFDFSTELCCQKVCLKMTKFRNSEIQFFERTVRTVVHVKVVLVEILENGVRKPLDHLLFVEVGHEWRVRVLWGLIVSFFFGLV